MLATTINPSNFMIFFLLISSSFRRYGYFGHAVIREIPELFFSQSAVLDKEQATENL